MTQTPPPPTLARRLCRPIRAERLTPLLFANIPNLVLYCVCFGYFFACTSTLISRYLAYETTVLIKYQQQSAQVPFPAVTLCGCSTTKVICGGISSDRVIEVEMAFYRNFSVAELLDEQSFREEDLVRRCDYILDSRKPNARQPCVNVEAVVESLHDGRKCFTYLSILHEGAHRNESAIERALDENSGNTSYLELEVNFREAVGLSTAEQLQALQDTNVYIALHPANMLPTFDDTEVLRLEPGYKYELHFGKQVTRLLEPPYRTNCRHYDPERKPRSQSECLRLCMLQRSYQFNSGRCINNYNMVTDGWLRHLNWSTQRSLHYCTEQTDQAYAAHITNRRLCSAECAQPDCLVEVYSFAAEWSRISGGQDDGDGINRSNRSTVQIWPDRKMYETVEHNKEIDIYQLIGCLGGHAHIFLGLSAIQLYDVFCGLIRRARRFYQQIV